jgi:hypothetical protein
MQKLKFYKINYIKSDFLINSIKGEFITFFQFSKSVQKKL